MKAADMVKQADRVRRGVRRLEPVFWPAIVATAAVFLAPPLFTFKALPWGVDQWGHLVRAELLREAVTAGEMVPAWLPHWYMGQDLWQYYPPLIYFFLLPASLVAGNALDGYTAMSGVIVGLTAIGFFWAFRPSLGTAGSFAGALAFTLAPVSLAPMFGDGNVPWALHHMILPWSFGLLLRLVEYRTGKWAGLFALSVAAMIPAHSMLAVMSVMGMTAFVIGRAIATWHTGDLRGFGLFVAAIGGGTAATAFWLIPGVTHVDIETVPALVGDKVVIWSGGPFIFDRSLSMEVLDTVGGVGVPPRYLGFTLPLIGLLGAAAAMVSRKHRALGVGLALMGLSTFIIAYGVKTPLFEFVPLHDSLLPNRILNVTIMPISALFGLIVRRILLAGALLPVQLRRFQFNWGLVVLSIITVTLMIEYVPFMIHRAPDRFIGDEVIQTLVLEDGTSPWEAGRYWDLTAINDSRQTYTVTFDANRFSVVGWANEGTVHLPMFSEVGRATFAGRPEQGVRLASLYNVEYAWIERGVPGQLEAFLANGFEIVQQDQFKALVKYNGLSSYMFEMDRDVLAIGFDALRLGAAYPWVAVGSTPYLEDYSDEFLDQFDTIVVAKPDLSRGTDLRHWIDRRLDARQRVVVDLVTSGSSSALGILTQRVPLEGPVTITSIGGEQEVLGPFGSPGAPFLTDLPTRSSTEAPTVSTESSDIPFYATVDVPAGELIAIPSAFIAHVADRPGDSASSEVLGRLIQSSLGPQNINPKPVLVTDVHEDPNYVQFHFESPSSGYKFLSITYSPHWRATIDGIPTEIARYENLMAVNAAAGEHTLALSYTLTPVQWASLPISVVGLVAIAVLAWVGSRLSMPRISAVSAATSPVNALNMLLENLFGEVEKPDSRRDRLDP